MTDLKLAIFRRTGVTSDDGEDYDVDCPVCGALNQIRIFETGYDCCQHTCSHFKDFVFGRMDNIVIGFFEE